jgi:hypothetical protein
MTSISTHDDPPNSRGWAATSGGVAARQRLADQMVDGSIAAVRYVNIDSVGMENPELWDKGPRRIVDAEEWLRPTWAFDGFHSINYGIEFELEDGRDFFVTWDPPSWTESLRFGQGSLIGQRPAQDASAAIWDVSGHRPWRETIGLQIESVELTYEPWAPEGGFWCTRIEFVTAKQRITVTDGEANYDGIREPAADNIAVLLDASDGQ